MSEYPVQCIKCGSWGYLHVTEWEERWICEKCLYEYAQEQGRKMQLNKTKIENDTR